MKNWVIVPYFLISFTSAALLFLAEPMIGKMALPPLGGTPAVWNTCLLYFQAILLLGYLLALAASRLDDRTPWMVLTALGILLSLGMVVQPIALGLSDTGQEYPALSLLAALMTATALPLGLIAATSPLTQHWFARTGHPRAHDPYFLYAASNAGSLLALVAYPLWIEPNLNLTAQSLIWERVYLGFAILMIFCGVLALGRSRRPSCKHLKIHEDGSRSPVGRDWLRWIVLSAIPSSWLMGVTTFLTTNLAAMPLLWVIPLAIFLIAFILAFAESTRALVWRASRLFPWLAVAVALVQIAGFVHAVWIPLHLVTFFLGCLVCDGRLAGSRPAAQFATSFYLTIALGGVLGGAFNVLVAPALFSGVVEYPLAIVGGCLVFQATRGRSADMPQTIQSLGRVAAIPLLLLICSLPLTLGLFGFQESLVGAGLLMMASGLGIYATLKAGERPVRFGLTVGAIFLAGLVATDPAGTTLLRSRDFYGVVRVTLDREANCRRLLHGGTLHGEQSLDPPLRLEPRTYFTRTGPIGDIFRSRRSKPRDDVAIVGLGVGTLAAYAESDERWTFYELDPTVVRIARDASLFTYLAECRAKALDFETGDARLRIRDEDDHRYAMIVLDAFGSDSVPVHLISREAIHLYLSKLALGGLLVFNITNGYIDLEPVMGIQARDAGLICRVRRDVQVSPEQRRLGKLGSIWAVIGRSEADLGDLVADSRWHAPRIRAGARAWTDDYSDLASYLFLFRRRVPEDISSITEPSDGGPSYQAVRKAVSRK